MATKKKKPVKDRMTKEETTDNMKKEIDTEQKAKDTIEWSNMELERSVRAMEMNVLQLEAGNHDADDSEIKQKYENQRQLNVQLQEQKRWLEHELEQVKLKIQNEKMQPLPDPFSLDWDNLSETELKRLVGQLEKTRNDLKSDLREMEWRLDKEGREYHHFDEFCRMYQAEIKNLNRILEQLVRNGVIPSGFQTHTVNNSTGSSYPSTGANTPGQVAFGSTYYPRKGTSSRSLSPPQSRRGGSFSPSRRKRTDFSPPGKSQTGSGQQQQQQQQVDPKLGPIRKTAGVRNLPKIERAEKAAKEKERREKEAEKELRTVKEER